MDRVVQRSKEWIVPAQLHAARRPFGLASTNEPSRAQNPQSRRIWDELAQRIGPHKFGMWFAHTTIDVSGNRILLTTDSPFVAKWIDANFADELRDVAEQLLGAPVAIDVRVAESESPPPPAATVRLAPASSTQAPISPVGLMPSQPPAAGSATASATQIPRRGNALRRLDDFVVGSCNKLAYSTACRLAEDRDGKSISPLFIHGECGVGKTHLLQGVCQRYIDITGRGRHVRYVTGEQFTNEYITALRNNSIEAFRQKIRKLDLLAIDDVHFLSNKIRTQSEFLYTIDAIDLSGARVVLASDNHPHHIKKFNQALVSRFLSGMVVKVERPDRDTRYELVRRLSAAKGLRVNDAAVEIIAANCVGSVREIEGAVTKLAAYRTLMNVSAGSANGYANGHANGSSGHTPEHHDEIGSVLAEKIFKEQPWQPAQIVRLASIIDAVCTRLGVVKADLLASGRHHRVVLARSLVAYLGRELTTHSFPEIAQALGRNNHSTIHTADQRLRKQLADNELINLGDGQSIISLKELIDQLRHDVLDRK